MRNQVAKKDAGGSQAPVGRPIETPARREKEIRRQAIHDARRSFNTVRDLLDTGVGPNPRSSGSVGR